MASVSHHELRELIAFHQRDGFMVERIELAIAQLTAVQINKAKGKAAKKVTPAELMPYHKVWRDYRNEIDNQFHADEMRREMASIGVRIVRRERKKKER